jgi:Family of unknown function (DUF6325)
MSDPDVHGPIDTSIIQFPSGATGAETAGALVFLLDQGVVRLYDLMAVERLPDGTCVEVDLADPSDGRLDGLSTLAGARSGLLGADDLDALADVLDPGAAALAIVYENTWAIPFVAAARAEGAELVAGSRLTAQEIMDALDALEATD